MEESVRQIKRLLAPTFNNIYRPCNVDMKERKVEKKKEIKQT